MAERLRLASPLDGFEFGAWRAEPPDARRGALVLIQEIFGVTSQIRRQGEAFAAEGYEVLAPGLYDRLEPGFEATLDPDGVARGLRYSEATPWDQVAADLSACVAALAPPVFAVGFCWGGTAAWLAACRCPGLSAVSCYYGRRIPELVEETPLCPTILHFGLGDASIPRPVIDAIAERHPDLPLFVYDAGHGFAADERADYRPDAARLAHLRTLQVFARNGGGRGEI